MNDYTPQNKKIVVATVVLIDTSYIADFYNHLYKFPSLKLVYSLESQKKLWIVSSKPGGQP